MFCCCCFARYSQAADPEPVAPTNGVLGLPLRSLVTVEGYCPRAKVDNDDIWGGWYQGLVVQKLNGQTLSNSVRVRIDSKTLYVPARTNVVMRGYEDVELRYGVTLRWWFKIVPVYYYATWFYPVEVSEPKGLAFIPEPVPDQRPNHAVEPTRASGGARGSP